MARSGIADFASGLDARLAPLDLEERLASIAEAGRAVLTTSLGKEDQVIAAAIGRLGLPIRVATLETGRLFDETLDLVEASERAFGIVIERFHPLGDDVEAYVAAYGRDGFYDSVEARRACCDIRKMRPLARALEDAAVWITGLRREQSGNRASTPLAEADPARGLVKVNPLADWTAPMLEAAIARHAIPINPLHARGYPSIGCAPCTRALRPGEPERAGRWWWERDDSRECGLHVAARPRSATATA